MIHKAFNQVLTLNCFLNTENFKTKKQTLKKVDEIKVPWKVENQQKHAKQKLLQYWLQNHTSTMKLHHMNKIQRGTHQSLK